MNFLFLANPLFWKDFNRSNLNFPLPSRSFSAVQAVDQSGPGPGSDTRYHSSGVLFYYSRVRLCAIAMPEPGTDKASFQSLNPDQLALQPIKAWLQALK